jgi:signal recognition particle subunit SRP54
MAGRILGMGDVVSLVEKAQEVMDEKSAEQQMEKMLQDRFSLEDFLAQLKTVRKMGSMKDLMGHLPGMPEGMDAGNVDEKQLDRTEAVMLSMTPAERRRPEQIDLSRKRRIARGSGTSIKSVDGLLKQFQGMQRMMKQLKKGGMMSRLASRFMPGAGGGLPDMGELAAPAAPARMPGVAGRSDTDRRKARKAERQRKKQGRRRR